MTTQAIPGFYRDSAGILMVYRRFAATAEFYTAMGLDPPPCAGFLGLSVFTSESPQTECGFQAIVDHLHRRRKATDHLVDPRQLDCDQVIARHEPIAQQAGILALDGRRLDQQVGRSGLIAHAKQRMPRRATSLSVREVREFRRPDPNLLLRRMSKVS